MIITNRQGRKKSILTPQEIDNRAGEIISTLSTEEQELFFGMLNDEPTEQLKVTETILEHRYHTQPVTMEQFLEDPYYLGESCATLYPELRKDIIELFKHPYREVVLTGGIGVGKCVERCTEVVHATTGERTTVEEAFLRSVEDGCATFDEDIGKTVNGKCRIMQSGTKNIGQLVLESGKKLGLSPDHPVLTPWGYRPVGALKPGDLVATSREMPEPEKPLEISDDEVIEAANQSKKDRVPGKLYGLSNVQLSLFVGKIWKHGGWLHRTGDCEWEAGISFAGEGFVRDMQQLLLRFGVQSKICSDKSRNLDWSLFIIGKDAMMKFLVCIGHMVGREDLRKDAHDELKFAKNEHDLSGWCSWWGGVFWDPIESYDVSDELEPVYDIEVPGTKNFAAHGIIVHNTFVLSIAICRVLYELSCLVNPQKTFGLSSGTEMVIPLISKNLILARDVMKTAVDDKLRESVYFMEKFTPKISKENTTFPNNVRVIVGSYGSERILGSNIFSVGLDECCDKNCLTSMMVRGAEVSMTVGDLWAMGPDERSKYQIVGFDHGSNTKKSGWWRIKESTVQELAEIKTSLGTISPSRKHPLLVRRGGWLVYEHAESIVPGDLVVMEDRDATQGSKVERGGEEENGRQGDNSVGSIKADGELKFAGVRAERTRVEDLPDGLCLVPVVSVGDLPPEQTYSICTEFQTFIADGFVVHNTNFPPARKHQQITTGFGQRRTAAHFDPVEKVYRNVLRRIKSRFQKAGGDFPGMVILASSAATLDSFTERKIRESIHDPDVFVRDHTPWTAKPEDDFCGEKFWVLCSTSSVQARILEESEYEDITDEYLEDHDAWLLDIPIEFLNDFETDIENAMRDIGGISTQAISIFVQRRDAVDACADPSIPHNFSFGEWTAGGPGSFLWKQMCREVERRLPGGYVETGYSPIVNPKKMRWCHIDTSISGDSTGFAMGHIDRWVEVVRRGEHGTKHPDHAPFYYIDLILRINPPRGEQIYLPDIRRLVYELQAHGYNFMGFSTDKYQYVEMHQQVKRRGIHCELISMDESVEPYNEVKRAIYEDRIRYHRYEPFLEELKALEYDRLKGKIDHPQTGSKDLSDAVAGVVHGLLSGSARLPIGLGADTSRENRNKHAWVSPMIPASSIDMEEVRSMVDESRDESEFLPILFGD